MEKPGIAIVIRRRLAKISKSITSTFHMSIAAIGVASFAVWMMNRMEERDEVEAGSVICRVFYAEGRHWAECIDNKGRTYKVPVSYDDAGPTVSLPWDMVRCQ